MAAAADPAAIDVMPDRRFRPICYRCGATGSIQQPEIRSIRNLNFASAQVPLRCSYRKMFCRQCGQFVVEDLESFDPYQRVTRRLARGYLQTAAGFLTSVEIDRLAFPARLIAFTMGLRFLTDHLVGDVYYRMHRPGHNLDRCRTQFAMVRDMEARADEMEAIVNKYR